AELAQAGDGLEYHAVGGGFLGRQVEQHGVHAGVGQVGGDLCAHDASAKDRGATYKEFLRHVLQPLDKNDYLASAKRPAVAKRMSSRAARSRCSASLAEAGRLIRPKSDMA